MEIKIGSSVILSYKRLPYSAWHALAEFVDNATQNYFDNRDELDEIYKKDDEDDSLVVRIVYDRTGDGFLRITDNSYGMDEEDLERALEVGRPPEAPFGRSRYGLGMKMAASWFGDKWTIVTKKLHSPIEYQVTIDVDKVGKGNAELELQKKAADENQHYTRIEIKNLNRQLHGRTVGKIKSFLAGMYRFDIENHELVLKWDDTPLDSSISWSFLKDREGKEYKKEFNFAIGEKQVIGWAGLLDPGGRAKAGFALIHNNRMVKTWPEAWYPGEIFGQDRPNDLVNQRLAGEIHLDDFDISHTKDDIHWADNEEEQVEDKLLELLENYMQVAKVHKKEKSYSEVDIQDAAQQLQVELESGRAKDLFEQEFPPPETIRKDDHTLIEETDKSEPDIRFNIPHNGKIYEVLILLDKTKSLNDPYVLYESSASDVIIVVVNMNHPHLRSVDNVLNHIRHCAYDALAEWKATLQNEPLDGGTIKRIKDQMLRLSIEIG